MKEVTFKPKDRIKVLSGKYAGRVGIFIKDCSVVFTDYCRIEFDLKKRERIKKTAMVLKSEIDHE